MRFGIVELSTGNVVGSYRAEQSAQDSYGGPYKDRALYAHLIIPSSMDAIPVQDLVAMHLEDAPLIDECGCPILEWAPGEPVEACTSMGEPILDAQGKQVKLVPYSKRPKMGSIYRIVQR